MALKGWFGRKWSALILMELQAQDCKDLALRQVSLGCPRVTCHNLQTHGVWAVLGARIKPACMVEDPKWAGLGLPWALGPDPHAWLQTQASESGVVLLSPDAGLKAKASRADLQTRSLRSGIRTQVSLDLYQDLGSWVLSLLI